MHKTFGADFRAARRRSGLTQEDCAHLLDIDQSQVSKLEAGKVEPTLRQLTTCYLVFGTWSRPLWNGVLRDLVDELRERLLTLPAEQSSWPQKAARRTTLDTLGRQLYDLSDDNDA
jgi:transcriptional regulator with XRE-family HTH domain